MLEASGYELARSGLGQGDFKGVTDIDARVARRTGSSARLTDLRIEADLQAAIAAYPDAVDLRLNYGQLLLDQRHFERAEAEFAAAVALDPKNALAHTGLGLAILEQAEDKHDYQTAVRALPHFQTAARLSPDDPTIQQNLTICQNRATFNAQPQAPADGTEH